MVGEPLYQRVKRELVAVIESGEFPPDVPFVTQRKICEQFGVSHATAVRALNDLVTGGYLKKIPIDPITHSDSTWVPTMDDTLQNVDQEDAQLRRR